MENIIGLSKEKKIAEKFAQGTLFDVDVISSKQIEKISIFEDEKEVILLAHTVFYIEKIINDWDKSKTMYVKL